MEKVWIIKDPDEYLKPRKRKVMPRETAPAFEKDPGRAYSLSLLFWGAGQDYNEERGKSLVFNILLIAAVVIIIIAAIYGRRFVRFLLSQGAAGADIFLGVEILFFCVLIFWRYNAGDAYHTAAQTRKTPYKGIKSKSFPFLCSLLMPGWGQFLNGQPLKGSFYSGFSVLALLSFAVIPSTIVVWPFLEPSCSRFAIEAIFAVAVLYSPLIPLVWIFGSFDALRVSLDELKKEPLWERIKSANNRRRTQGWVRGLFPQVQSTILLALILTSLVIVILHAFPWQYYLDELMHVRLRMQEQGMMLVPDMIDTFLTSAWQLGK
jgi:TM2 domain-containing membrane protein YozV